jgi:hypothetical protein
LCRPLVNARIIGMASDMPDAVTRLRVCRQAASESATHLASMLLMITNVHDLNLI